MKLDITNERDLYEFASKTKCMYAQKLILDNGMEVVKTSNTPIECKYKIGDSIMQPIFGTSERGNMTVEYYVCKIVEIKMT